jgi:hypothetical protein
MKIEFKLKGRWKSFHFYTKKCETIVRYWGGLKFDVVKLYAGI